MQHTPARVFIISDLHLGGAPATDDQPAFQMCTEQGRAALVEFIAWATQQKQPGQSLHLVIAGDIIDFLAEERAGGFFPFTSDSELACSKLEFVLADTALIWEAMRKFLAVGSLTLLLGNHDLELSMPGPRRLLLDTLGPGRVEFLYDNQAFTLGPLLVEHGNRYDDWNAVPHDDLREVRSRLSRGEEVTFDPLPGSRMVIELVNPTKKELAFVDLLKPEDAALMPFLALLSPNRYKQVSLTLKNRVRALRVRYGAGRQPKDRNFIGLDDDPGLAADFGTGDTKDDDLLAMAEAAACGGADPAMAGAGDPESFFKRWKEAATEAYRNTLLEVLLRTLQAFRGKSRAAFALDSEEEKYLLGATESAAKGFKVIVYGHTHLPKKISLGERTAVDGTRHDAVYLNSGTWADLMAVPDGVLDGDPDAPETHAALQAFADDLANNRVDRWRRLLPTFVDVTLNGADVVAADVCMLDEQGGKVALTTELIRQRLTGSAG